MLEDALIKPIYNSDYDNLLEDFLIPSLSKSKKFDRSVGYWSSNIFKIAAQGLSVFIQNGGKIRLIVGTLTSIEDYDALIKGYDQKLIEEKYGKNFNKQFDKFDDDLQKFRLDCLSWLIASNQLEIKIAHRKNGIFHAKHGILTDDKNNNVVFSGSANDSQHAFDDEFNYEELNVFKSWASEAEQERCNYHKSQFEDLWEDRSKNTKVLPLANINRDFFVNRANKLKESELTISRELDLINFENKFVSPKKPRIPAYINEKVFKIFDHQANALNKWKLNGQYKGIFALATGTGKTITSIFGAVKIFEESEEMCLIVIVPYLSLAEQWISELSAFNIHAIKCYDKLQNWESKLEDQISKFQSNTLNFLPIVVLNKTLNTQPFQNLLNKINSKFIMVIGDECHYHGAENTNNNLPQRAEYRIGLSATPNHYIKEENNLRLKKYYGNIEAEFSLEEAVKKNILCPYEYHVINVELTPDEQEEFRDLSIEISRQYAISGEFSDNMAYLVSRRTRLLGNAQNKIIALEDLLRRKKPEPYSLFYCGEGRSENNFSYEDEQFNSNEDSELVGTRQIDIVTSLLHNNGWKTSKFTNNESPSIKKLILNNFKTGKVDSLIAMKCLDEGIDIPLCKTAFILASSKNPRQFIQRRGRILRKHPQKEKAIIYDFFVSLPLFDEKNKNDKRLFKQEIERVDEFRRLSINPNDAYEVLKPLLIKYDMQEML